MTADDREASMAEARAVAGPDAIADGGLTAAGDREVAADADALETLCVGDHVRDRDDADARMVVVGLTGSPAFDFEIDADGGELFTVAELNPSFPSDDDVVQVVFPSRATTDVSQLTRYAYPRSRLERVASVE